MMTILIVLFVLDAWKKVGLMPLMNEVNKLGGLPMIDKHWDGSNFKWIDAVTRLRKIFGANYLIGMGVSPDSFNSSKYVIRVNLLVVLVILNVDIFLQ